MNEIDLFVIRVSFGERTALVGTYPTFNSAEEIAGRFELLESVDRVRVDVWSYRVLKRYGSVFPRERVEELLVRLVKLGQEVKSRRLSTVDARRTSRNIERLVKSELSIT